MSPPGIIFSFFLYDFIKASFIPEVKRSSMKNKKYKDN